MFQVLHKFLRIISPFSSSYFKLLCTTCSIKNVKISSIKNHSCCSYIYNNDSRCTAMIRILNLLYKVLNFIAEKIESNNRNYRDMSDVPWSLRILFILRALQFIFAKFMVSLEDRLETATKDINYSFNQDSCFGKKTGEVPFFIS